jgi:CheY-like chemotaxis protein
LLTPGLEAVALFTKSLSSNYSINAFDCVFMDREMPVMDGVEVKQ